MLHVCTMFVAAIGWPPVLLADAFKAARHICEHYHMQAPDLDIVTAEGYTTPQNISLYVL